MVKQIKFITLLLLTFFFTGCLWVPLVTKKHTVSKDEIDSFVIGRSAKKEVYEILGKPNCLEQKKYCVYEVESSRGLLIWAVPYGGGAGVEDLGGPQYRILLEFDQNDILRNYDIEKGFKDSWSGSGIKYGVASKSASLKTHKTVLLWGKSGQSFYHSTIATSSDKQLLAIKSIHGSVWLINLDTSENVRLENTRDLKYFKLSPDGRYLAYVLNFINVLDTATLRQVSIFKGHGKYSFWPIKSGPTVLAFFPDGNKIASGGRDGFVKIWEAMTGIEINSFKAYEKSVSSIAISPDGKMLATAGGTSIILWDPLTGYEFDRINNAGDLKNLHYGLKFSPNGNILAINKGSHLELLRINKKWASFEGLEDVFLLPFAGREYNTWRFIDFSRDGRNIAASNGSSIVWDIERQRKIWRHVAIYNRWRWRGPDLPSAIHAIAFCQNKNLLIVTTDMGVFLIKMQPPD
ncbi:MAG: WD40 repeat domain-containing protein [Planctomycetota bacterium]|jgi:WD40 repeat protein